MDLPLLHGEKCLSVVLHPKSTNIEPWLYRFFGNDEAEIVVNLEHIAYGKEEPNERKKQVKRWQLV